MREAARMLAVCSSLSWNMPWARRQRSAAMRAILGKLSPVCFYYPAIALASRQMYYEWGLLDTHDATTDWYKNLRTAGEIESFLESLGAEAISVVNDGNGVEAFCRKPSEGSADRPN